MRLRVLAAVWLATTPAQAQVRPWAVGGAIGAPSFPTGHLGVPLAGARLPFALTVQRALSEHLALEVGAGLPHTGTALSVWAATEFSARVAGDARGWNLALYGAPGAQLGFAGPDQPARQSGVFVGFAYAYQPPWAFAMRFPTGLRLRVADGRFDLFAEIVPIVALAPSAELLLSSMFGLRVRLGSRVYAP